jgi:site-specific DNA-adenine methylase
MGKSRAAAKDVGRLTDKVDVDLTRISFAQRDVYDLLAEPIADAFYYFDPPYDGMEDYYFVGKSFDNDAFAAALRDFTGVHGKYWAMSNSDTPRIRALYGDWCDIMVVSWNYASAHGEGHELLIRPRF